HAVDADHSRAGIEQRARRVKANETRGPGDHNGALPGLPARMWHAGRPRLETRLSWVEYRHSSGRIALDEPTKRPSRVWRRSRGDRDLERPIFRAGVCRGFLAARRVFGLAWQ